MGEKIFWKCNMIVVNGNGKERKYLRDLVKFSFFFYVICINWFFFELV